MVVAGDFRQLPPIVVSDDPLAHEWLKKDAFDKAGISQAVSKRTAPDYLAKLRVQYRMRADICRVTSELFYDDHKLETDPIVKTLESPRMPLGPAQLLYIDSTSLHPGPR